MNDIHLGNAHSLRPAFGLRVLVLATVLTVGLPPTGVAQELSPAERKQFADALFQRAMYEQALSEYLAAAELLPDSTDQVVVLYRAAECARELNRIQEALHLYDRVMKMGLPGEYGYKAGLRRADLLTRLGRTLEALQTLQDLAKAQGHDEWLAQTWVRLGAVYESLSRAQDAASAYREIARCWPTAPVYPLACLRLAELERATGGSEETIRRLYREASSASNAPQVSAEALFRWGEWEAANERWDRAVDTLDRLLKQHPDSEFAQGGRRLLALAAFQTQRYELAMKCVEQILREGDDADALLLKGRILSAMDQSYEAEKIWDQLLEKLPHQHELRPEVLYEKARSELQKGRFQAASELALQAAADPTMRGRALALHADAFAKMGHKEKALEVYRTITASLADTSQQIRAWFEVGRLSQELGATNDAIAAYEEVRAQSGDANFVAPALHALGALYEIAERYDEASHRWKELLRRFPSYGRKDEVLYRLAALAWKQGDYRECVATVDELAREFPQSEWRARGEWLRASVMEQSGNWPAAEQAYRQVIELRPTNSLAEQSRLRLGYVLYQQGREEEALSAYEEALVSSQEGHVPNELLEWILRRALLVDRWSLAERAAELLLRSADTDERKAVAHWGCARARRAVGQHDKALESMQQALATGADWPERADAWLEFGEWLLEAGRMEEARGAFEKAASLSSDEAAAARRAHAYRGLARVAEETDDWASAYRYALAVGLLFDDRELSAECLYRAGVAAERLGKIEERDRIWKELQERYPDSPWAMRIRNNEGVSP